MRKFIGTWQRLFALGGVFQLSLTGAFSLAQAEEFPVVPAPCIKATSVGEIKQAKSAGSDYAGMRTCKEMMDGGGDKTKDPGFLKSFDKQIEDYAENLYKGCSLDMSSKEKIKLPNGFECQGTPVMGATCNILQDGVPPTFNKKLESSADHNGNSCGQWPLFDSHTSGKRCIIRPYYWNANGIHYYSDPPQFIEESYNRGAFIQALNCFHQQVRNELATYKLKITDSGHAPMLQHLNEAKKAATVTSKSIKSEFGAEANLTDVENCTGDEKGSSTDVGKMRQSACQLSAARLSQESMFMQLAAAEVFSRARKSYEQFLGGSPNQNLITKAARDAMQGLRAKRSECSNDRVLNAWYKPRFSNLFHSKAARIWNAQSCQ